MQRLVLRRLETGDQGTFGVIELPSGDQIFTGEQPDRGNAPSISCIPAGLYRCDWTYSPAFRRMMYLVHPVPGRSGIRIHSANLMGDRALGFKSHLEGCIAPGGARGYIQGQKAILRSAPAVSALEAAMQRQPFELEIQPC